MAEYLLREINRREEHLPLCDKTFIAHPTGALIWPEEATLIVSDLYLRSGGSLSAMLQPSLKTQASELLGAIRALIDTHAIKQVIAIGRPFRRLDDPYHIHGNDLNILYDIQKQVDWIWVAGGMSRHLPSLVGGIRASSYNHGNFDFRAQPRNVPVAYEIAGGMYPMAKIACEYGGQDLQKEISYPCFVSNGKRLIMPSFGGKLCARNILSDEFLPFFDYDDLMVQAVDQYRTFPLPRHSLAAG
ncbi:MAG: metallophosphatase [Rhodomicrobium sp.]|nr:MAG: metallophosphatase [Rhodomicrobium sp.]